MLAGEGEDGGEEEDVGLDTLGVKDARGQAQEGVQVAFLQQLAPHRFAGAAFKKDVVGHDDGRLAVDFQQFVDVLHEIQLLIAGGGPEVVVR